MAGLTARQVGTTRDATAAGHRATADQTARRTLGVIRQHRRLPLRRARVGGRLPGPGLALPGIDHPIVFEPAAVAMREVGNAYRSVLMYGPPWGVLFGAVGGGPTGVLHVLLIGLDFVALWSIAGRSWKRAGWLMWFPLVVTEMAAGQLNLLCAAAIVEAQRHTVWPLALMAWAKLWPALALPLRDWRAFALAALAFGVLALPWPNLFPSWIAALLGNIADPIAPLIPIPFLVRLPIAIALVAWQRPWSRALGALLASPNLYAGQLVVLLAPLSLAFLVDEPPGSPGCRPSRISSGGTRHPSPASSGGRPRDTRGRGRRPSRCRGLASVRSPVTRPRGSTPRRDRPGRSDP